MDIELFTTGGTIDKVYFDAKGGYEIGTPMVREILDQARMLQPIAITELLRKDSLEFTDDDRAVVRAAVVASLCRCIVITHGTDTIVDTARSLIGIADKTIVLTGALQPARFRDSDASFNLGMAIGVAQVLPSGAYVVANGAVFHADNVWKNRETNRFEARG